MRCGVCGHELTAYPPGYPEGFRTPDHGGTSWCPYDDEADHVGARNLRLLVDARITGKPVRIRLGRVTATRAYVHGITGDGIVLAGTKNGDIHARYPLETIKEVLRIG